jgi:hypothetical protein
MLNTFWIDWTDGRMIRFKSRGCMTLGKGCKQIP